MKYKQAQAFLIPFLCLFLGISGCSVFSDYRGSTSGAYSSFQGGNFDSAINSYDQGTSDPNVEVLQFLEGGTAAHVAGDYNASKTRFAKAESVMRQFEDRATVSATGSLEGLSSLTLNDKTKPYEGIAFEKVLLNTYQALNYLMLGDPNGALIEIRRAQFQQDQAYKKYLEEIEADKKQEVPESSQVFVLDFKRKFEERAKQDLQSLKNDSNVFQLANTFYLSSIIYEMNGQLDEAAIDLRKILKYNPGFQYAAVDLMKQAQKKGNRSDISIAQNLGGGNASIPEDAGSIVIFFQCDQAPLKVEHSIVVPTGGAGFQKIAWPFYEAAPFQTSHLELEMNGTSYQTQELSDVNSIAIRYFIEYSRSQLTRTALRISLKIAQQKVAQHAVTQSSGSGLGALTGFTASAINSFTEQADLRCWLTLPRSFQALRAYLPPGVHSGIIKVKSANGGVAHQVNLNQVKIKSNRTLVFIARSLGNNIYLDSFPKMK